MKRRLIIFSLIAAIIIVAGGVGIARHRADQRRPVWERYALPRLQFRGEPTTNVVVAINAAMQKASGGAVSRVVILDTTPATIQTVTTDQAIQHHMEELIADFRRDEVDLVRKGALGYETAPYSGTIEGKDWLCCFAEDIAAQSNLNAEVGADGLHLSRQPRQLECRAYRISDGLKAAMEQEQKTKQFLVGAEPIVSAFAHATEIHEWTIMVPSGPDSSTGQFRIDKVFRHLSDLGIILAIATPQEHVEAERRLRDSGCWAEME